ncbi:MAG: polyprenyl synthetase family protein [Oscillospiraceae bacterium]|nr:polyprenyl synthetase family protein [Oscillospiraceae bacterium]
MKIKERLKGQIELIDGYLDKYLAEKENPQNIIYKAMRYSVFAGGKRLRPILMLNTCKMLGGDTDEVIPFACAIEMIHTYSLIHDDLPAMDNDDLRRGMPTSHIKFGEATAILAGDALLNRAFEIVSEYDGNNIKRAMTAINILARSSGTEGMIGGQVVDMESEGKDITLDELRYLHLNKTGAIIRSACAVGALMGGADKEEMDAIDEFAKNLGIAFQIQDDILDVTGSEEELGKPIGSDKEENKNTYVKLAGLEKSVKMAAEYSEKAKKSLGIFGEKADFLTELTDYLTNRKY